MDEHEDDIHVPAHMLAGVGALILFTVTAIVVGRENQVGLYSAPEIVNDSGRTLIFDPQDDGTMTVSDIDGAEIMTLEIEGGTFAMAAVRGLAMQRPKQEREDAMELVLRRDHEGRLDLYDPETRRKVPLVGFGPDNIAAFAAYLGTDPSRS